MDRDRQTMKEIGKIGETKGGLGYREKLVHPGLQFLFTSEVPMGTVCLCLNAWSAGCVQRKLLCVSPLRGWHSRSSVLEEAGCTLSHWPPPSFMHSFFLSALLSRCVLTGALSMTLQRDLHHCSIRFC